METMINVLAEVGVAMRLFIIGLELSLEHLKRRAGDVSLGLLSLRLVLSLTDCASFEVMRALGISRALCFGPHFSERGFTRMP